MRGNRVGGRRRKECSRATGKGRTRYANLSCSFSGEKRKRMVKEKEESDAKKGVQRAVFKVELVWRTVRPTQTGPRLKTLRAAYSLFSFFLLPSRPRHSHLPSSGPCNTLAFTSKRPVHVRSSTRNDQGICAYNRPQTHLLRSYSFLENY